MNLIVFKRLEMAGMLAVQRLVDGDVKEALVYHENKCAVYLHTPVRDDSFLTRCPALNGKDCEPILVPVAEEEVQAQSTIDGKFEALETIFRLRESQEF